MRRNGHSHGAVSPCAACKLLRRKCVEDCVFAPYFPAKEPYKFAIVHKIFGASNVSKMLQVKIHLSILSILILYLWPDIYNYETYLYCNVQKKKTYLYWEKGIIV